MNDERVHRAQGKQRGEEAPQERERERVFVCGVWSRGMVLWCCINAHNDFAPFFALMQFFVGGGEYFFHCERWFSF